MRGEKREGKTGPGRQVQLCCPEASNRPITWNENGLTVWSQLSYALLTHFNIMMGRFKNAFLLESSVCRGDGPTGGRPPAARPHVLAGQWLRITSNCRAPQRETSHRKYSLEEEKENTSTLAEVREYVEVYRCFQMLRYVMQIMFPLNTSLMYPGTSFTLWLSIH